MIQFAAASGGEQGIVREQNGGVGEPFLIGPENQLVGRVVAAVVDLLSGAKRDDAPPPTWLNPLVVVGPPGSGKSHLVQGLVSLAIRQSTERAEVVETTAFDFASRYLAAAEEDTLPEFHAQLLRARVWAVEDLSRLPKRASIQTKFVQTLDEQLRQGTLVVATACRPPQQLSNLAAGIRSRLEGGLIVTLSPPGLAVRRELLRRAAVAHHVRVETEEIEELARRVQGTPRQLFGEIQRRKLDHVMESESPSEGKRRGGGKALKVRSSVEIANILAITSRYFGVSQAAMKSASRRQSVVHARSVAMYLARELAGATLQEIGAVLGGRDHTTVMHACRKVDRFATQEATVQEELADLRRLLLTT